MNPNLRIENIGRASAAAVIAVALLAFALLPQPARADWRSLSGGFLPAFADTPYFAISPDSRTVAFVTDKDTDEVYELYAVPITGTTPIKLNPPLVNGGDVTTGRFQFTPDGQYVIYLADQEVDNRIELYRVPVGGGQSAKLNPFLTTEGNVVDFRIDPGSGRVVYVADQETDDTFELYSVPITGGASVKLSGTMVSGGDVGYFFEFERRTRRVVFRADRETDEKFELYSAPITGGAPARLHPPLVGGGYRGIDFFAVNPVIPVVVFIARFVGTPRERLYMIPVGDNIPPTPLSFDLASNQQLLTFVISPTGDRVVYNVHSRSAEYLNKGTLHSVPIGGGDSIMLTDFADPDYGVDVSDFRFTPDGTRVVYTFQRGAAAGPYTGPYLASALHTGAWTTLHHPYASDETFVNFNISPNGQWVWFQTDNGLPSKRLYTIPPGGGSPTDHGFTLTGFVTMLPDSSRIVYTRYISVTTGANDLFSAAIAGGDERNLSGLNGVGDVGTVVMSKDGKWIVFVVELNGRYDLRVSDGKPTQPPTTPSPTPSPTPPVTPTPTAPAAHKAYLPVVVR